MERLIKNYLLLIYLSFVWGSSFILMKKALISYSFTQVAALRILIAFLTLVPFIYQSFKKVKKKYFIPIFIVGFLGNGLPAFLFAKAQTFLDSSVVGILNSLVPLFTLLIGVICFKKMIKKLNILGVIIGLLGALLLMYFTSNRVLVINIYILLVIVATIMYSISVNVIDNYLNDFNSVHITTLSFLVIAPFSLCFLDIDDILKISSTSKGLESLIYVIILAILGTSSAVIIFNILIKRSSAIFASSVTYLIPVVAIFWGFYDAEHITLTHIFSIIMILCGVFLINKR